MTSKVVRVGVGVIIKDPLKPNHIFAGIRRGSHGEGMLALPGGHLERFETWEECAQREVIEETGLILQKDKIQFGYVTNDMMKSEDKHYVTIFMMGECSDSIERPKNLEPHKCQGWDSYHWDTLREMIILGGNNNEGVDQKQNLESQEIKALKLFGPLQRLVEDSPSNVLEFISS
jgi:8-oxo-dGTP diphosphatase